MNEPSLARIDHDLAETIKTMAETERRSFAGQVNYLLRLALEPAGRDDA